MRTIITNDRSVNGQVWVTADLTGRIKSGELEICNNCNERNVELKIIAAYDLDDDEKTLNSVCGQIFDYALKNGYTDIVFDAATFAGVSDLFYIVNTLINVFSVFSENPSFNNFTVTVLLAEDDSIKELNRELDEELLEPVLETVKHAYGAYGDPLKDEFERFQKSLENEKTFREYLVDLMELKGVRKSSEVYKAAGVSKYTFSKITNFSLNPPHKPSKETVAALAIGLKLNLQEAEEFYNYAGFHLGLTEFVDKVIRFFIKKGIYKIYDINYCLVEHGYLPLGEKPRKEKVEIKIK